jgi:hypothetical protein
MYLSLKAKAITLNPTPKVKGKEICGESYFVINYLQVTSLVLLFPSYF